MPLFKEKKTSTRGNAPPTTIRKSRASTKSVNLPGGKSKDLTADKEASVTSNTALAGPPGTGATGALAASDSDSEDETAKHTEVLPASDVTIYNAYNMGPAFGCKFPIPFIRYTVERLLNQKFKGKTYQATDAVKWVREVADEVNLKMEGKCRQPRYKHVIQTIIYQQNGAGFLCGARAVWDQLSDDYVCCTYDGSTFIAIVIVFGLYQY